MNRPLAPGDPAPVFKARAIGGHPNYAFNTVAGRYVLLLFCDSAQSEAGAAAALRLVAAHRALFDDTHAAFFGITCDPADEAEGRVAQQLPGIRFFLDPDRSLHRLYGIGEPCWLLLDPMLRVLAHGPANEGQAVMARLAALHGQMPDEGNAPVLILPRVFEPELCHTLIGLYERFGGKESGFMNEVNGKTVALINHDHKRRADHTIGDEQLKAALRDRLQRRLISEVAKVFQFHATRMERYIVACYDAATGGHFRPHRDNTTKGTAHRRFAVTINLNAEDYTGGDLRFPEFGRKTYRAPTGGAVVFSCSLLHEATPVTQGKRYAFLPFLYDEAAAKVREANNPYLDESIGAYQMHQR